MKENEMVSGDCPYPNIYRVIKRVVIILLEELLRNEHSEEGSSLFSLVIPAAMKKRKDQGSIATNKLCQVKMSKPASEL